MSMRDRRGTIALEQAEILSHTAFAGNQYVLRMHAPVTSQRARPGQFVHLQCTSDIPLRRPLSIMRTDPPAGWIEVLYKPVGAGLGALTQKQVQQTLSVLGPIGNGFDWSYKPQRILALGGGVGIPPMIFAAQFLSRSDVEFTVYMGSEIPFPFELTAATFATPGIDSTGKSTVALLDEWGVPSVLTSRAGLAGSHDGFVTELAARSLATLGADELEQTLLLACGPEPMLAAAARLADEFGVRCQLALEEYMACGVGGCAGCTVEVHTAGGIQMQRVCVDGPVFEAAMIYPAA
jgi:dihydroorotate dehydrogenase electron transfer subunit